MTIVIINTIMAIVRLIVIIFSRKSPIMTRFADKVYTQLLHLIFRYNLILPAT